MNTQVDTIPYNATTGIEYKGRNIAVLMSKNYTVDVQKYLEANGLTALRPYAKRLTSLPISSYQTGVSWCKRYKD